MKVEESREAMHVRNETDFDDELLEKHDDYIRVLQERLEKMKPIIRIIERREIILRERLEYEELQKDSDRLKQRGAAMAKQLMEEEKMAKRIKKDLPRLSKLLEQKLDEWLHETGEEFQYGGEIYSEVMKRQDKEWAEYKASEMQLKLKKKQDKRQNKKSTVSVPVPTVTCTAIWNTVTQEERFLLLQYDP